MNTRSFMLWFIGIGVTLIVLFVGVYATQWGVRWYWEDQYSKQIISMDQKYGSKIVELENQIDAYLGE